MRNKELWIQVRLLSNTLRENSSITNGGVVCVSIPWQINNLQLKKHVYRQLNLEHVLDEEKVVFKLRNFSGALVPLSNQLESNAKDCPFVLEVVDIHQHVQAVEWQVPVLHRENLTNRIDILSNRVGNLEQKMDGLSEDYANKLADELKFLSTQTAVLKHIVTENKDE